MKIITGRRHCVLIEESSRLTTMGGCCLMPSSLSKLLFVTHSRVLFVLNVTEYGFEPQDHLRSLFRGFSGFLFFLFFENLNFLYFLYNFNFTRTMKIITGRRHWVLTEESPRLTTMGGCCLMPSFLSKQCRFNTFCHTHENHIILVCSSCLFFFI